MKSAVTDHSTTKRRFKNLRVMIAEVTRHFVGFTTPKVGSPLNVVGVKRVAAKGTRDFNQPASIQLTLGHRIRGNLIMPLLNSKNTLY